MKRLLSKISVILIALTTILTASSCSVLLSPMDSTFDANTTVEVSTTQETVLHEDENSSPEKLGKWDLRGYVDNSNHPTDGNFICTTVNGVFSNSVTNNADLTAQIQVDTEDVSIVLYEYGRNVVKCAYDYDDYTITMIDTNNQKHQLSGTMYAGGFRLYLDHDDKATVLDALKASGEINFRVVSSKFSTNTYTFTVETSNFSSLYGTLESLS